MAQRPEVSIIIVSYRTPVLLRDCLASVAGQRDVDFEVIVVDNASGDGTVEMVRSGFPAVRLIASEENLGFSPANNRAMELARGRHLLLLNPDTVMDAGSLALWLRRHAERGAGISGPRLLNPDRSLQPSAWKVPGFVASLLELFLLHRLLGAHRYPAARFSADFQPEFISGAAMLFDRSVYERVGGLDAGMFWMEDADLCVRVRALGASCWYLHEPTIVHIGGQSAARNLRRAISNQLISRIKFARKHHGMLAAAPVAMVVTLHALTRAMAFSLLALGRTEPRADAYRHALVRLYRYIILGDRSI